MGFCNLIHYRELNCVPRERHADVLTLVPVNVALFGNSFCRHNQVKMTSLGRALIQYERCRYKNREDDVMAGREEAV